MQLIVLLLSILLTLNNYCIAKCNQNDILVILDDLLPTKLSSNANIEEITLHYQALLRRKPILENTNIDLQRFVNMDDWNSPLRRKFQNDPKRAYGPKAARSWAEGLRFINRNAKETPLDAKTLKKIHQISFNRMPFHGYEGRRILARYKKGEINEVTFKELLRQAYKENKEISGTSHSSLRGQYRSDSIDEIEHRGSAFDKNGNRYFTQKELQAIRNNPYMRVDESSIKKTGNNQYTGTSYFHSVRNIEQKVNDVLKTANQSLMTASTTTKKIEIILKMEKDLISIHPFLDGNGRSVRLLGDMARMKYDLPPSLYPNEQDLTMSPQELLNFEKKGMIDYINQWSKLVREEP